MKELIPSSHSDILHRHYKRCVSRGTEPIPQPLKRGKRKRACDACSRSKLFCDSDSPCETCLRNDLPCTYLRVEQEATRIETLSQNSSTHSKALTISDLYRWSTAGEINQAILVAVTRIPRDQQASADQREAHHVSQRRGHRTQSFLLNYIDPKVRSVTDTFGYTAGSPLDDPGDSGTESAGVGRMSSLSFAYHPVMLQSTPFDANEVPNILQPVSSNDQQLLEYFFLDQNASGTQLDLDPYLEGEQPWFMEPIAASWNVNNRLTDDLMYHLHEFCSTLPAGHPEANPDRNLTPGLELISPSNITKFVNLYFYHWNRHSPIIHRGTFDPGKASIPLLFIVILTGALFSSQDDAAKARALLDLAEEYAFRNRPFERLLAGDPLTGSDGDRTSLDAIQAAFSVAQLQLREGSANVKKHTRSVRFGQIIQVSHKLEHK